MRTYIHYGHTSFNKDLFTKITNEVPMSKPKGGLWASDINAKYGWKDWCKSENFAECNKENSFTLTLSDSANVLYIKSVKDLENLPKAQNKFGFTSWIVLDFEKLAESYDAIEVNISSDYNLYYKLYGWDCDSILIMNPAVVICK